MAVGQDSRQLAEREASSMLCDLLNDDNALFLVPAWISSEIPAMFDDALTDPTHRLPLWPVHQDVVDHGAGVVNGIVTRQWRRHPWPVMAYHSNGTTNDRRQIL